jgi:hypothetical protein
MKLRTRSLVSAVNIVVYIFGVTALASLTWGNTEYYRHVIFDNSLTSDAYFYSQGLANGSSSLELKNGHLPVRDGRELPHRLVWKSFMANPEIGGMLQRLDQVTQQTQR